MLNERKIQILEAIIHDYIATAEPVGSRTIAKKYDLGVSSATIRNEMSDLEDLGLIIQPHASAGRIPSDLGYRLYVDRLMKYRELAANEEEFLQRVVADNVTTIEFLMEETAKALSRLTRYTTMVSEPVAEQPKLKQIRLMPLDDVSLLLIVATEENFIKNHIIRVSSAPSEEDVFVISGILNNSLKGHSISSIDDGVLAKLALDLKQYAGIIPPLMKALEATLGAAEDMQVHLSGAKNILAYPEFSDVNKAKTLFQTLEEKDVLVTLLANPKDEIQILIGNEIEIQEMKDCSVITTTYKMGDNTRGSIGILGPTRMDYSQVVSVLNGMVRNIETVLKSLSEEKKDDT